MILNVRVGFLVDRVVGQVDEPLLQTGLGGRVGDRRKSDQAVLEHVDLEGVEADDQDVDSEVVLVAAN